MSDPVKYLVTVTAHALLVELRVPIAVPDLTQFAVTHRLELNVIFNAAARLVQQEVATMLKDCADAG